MIKIFLFDYFMFKLYQTRHKNRLTFNRGQARVNPNGANGQGTGPSIPGERELSPRSR